MNKKVKNNAGMAIVIVLGLSVVILALGTTYMKIYTNSAPASKLQLDRVQADFFARGIQNIALLKIRKYPDYFIRSYRQLMYMKRVETDGLPPLSDDQKKLPLPFESFMGRNAMSGDYEGIFFNGLSEASVAPLRIASYSTGISIFSSSDFATSSLEITVGVQFTGKNNINTFKSAYETSKIRIMD